MPQNSSESQLIPNSKAVHRTNSTRIRVDSAFIRACHRLSFKNRLHHGPSQKEYTIKTATAQTSNNTKEIMPRGHSGQQNLAAGIVCPEVPFRKKPRRPKESFGLPGSSLPQVARHFARKDRKRVVHAQRLPQRQQNHFFRCSFNGGVHLPRTALINGPIFVFAANLKMRRQFVGALHRSGFGGRQWLAFG